MVGIFPEATISRFWTLRPFMRGAATLATCEQVPLIPVAVWGGQRILTVGGRWSLRRGKAIRILIGEPIRPAQAITDPADTRVGHLSEHDRVASVNAMLRQQMQSLVDQAQRDYPDSPRDDADRWWMPQHLGGSAPTPEESAELDLTGMLR
jgi:1-acyl-sn-glycerol-3-phosphate acyltransferase